MQRGRLEVVGEDDVLVIDIALREIELDLVTEAAGQSALGAKDQPAGAAVETEIAEVQPADGAAPDALSADSGAPFQLGTAFACCAFTPWSASCKAST